MAEKTRLFLIDGMAIAYRSYFAFIQRPLINSKGENTSAVYGFVTFLNKILEEEQPEHIAVVFDTSKPTFRHEQYAAYKATRQKMPEDMVSQLDVLKDVVRAYNIPVVELDGFEADDIMGTLARRAEKEDVETYLVTSDKDFMQLVSKKTKIYKPGRQGNDVEVVSFDEVKEKFGVTPDKVIDVLGLTGDKSDNVPGVPGIGEKTAIPLVQAYGTIEEILANVDKIPQKGVQEKLKSNKDKALLSKKLVTIDTNVPVKVDFHELNVGKKDIQKLTYLFEQLEFRSLVRKLKEEGGAKPPRQPDAEEISFGPPPVLTEISSDEHDYRLVTTEKEFEALCTKLSRAKRFSFDTETTSTDPLRAEVVGLSFALKPREAYFVALASDQESGEDTASTDLFGTKEKAAKHSGKPKAQESRGLSSSYVFTTLKPLLEDHRIKKIGQNVKYDMLAVSHHEIWVRGIEFDTMLASYILRADGQHNLDALAREHLDYKMISYSELVGTGKEQKLIRDVPLQQLSDYSCQDADITLRLAEVLKKKLQDQQTLTLCEEIEFPLLSVLAKMEHAGVAIDVGVLDDMSKELERTLDNLTRDIHKLAGDEFNINSTQQLSDILFNKLKLNPVRKTKTGFSTDVAVLEALQHQHPIIEYLLEYRQLTKLKSTYVDALPKLINPRTGRVHTSFNQTVATTGRLSSSDPNLQNIPIRTEIGRSIRKAFIPGSKQSLIMSADYSQIELRVMAHVCGDSGLREAFQHGEDIHASTAAKVFGVSASEITRDMRRKAKEVNFGIMYGIGPFGLANRLEISQTEARDIINRYFERFQKVRHYIDDTIAMARKDGYVSTLLGRRRYLPDIHSRNQNIRQNAERQAINMPIQGTAADMIKLAMIHIDKAIEQAHLKSAMILQVHDELVFEVPKSEEEQMKKLVRDNMQNALKLEVPIEVEIGVGKNWLEAH